VNAVHVTDHAIERAIERIGCTPAEAQTLLSSKSVRSAATFGAPYVKLPGGQRIVLEGFNVVTVLPVGCPHWRLGVPK
jgi:hypothetical protein